MPSTAATEEPAYRTITLTDRPPVRIAEDDWPVIAAAKFLDYDGKIRAQANREWSGSLRVRQHDDGRVIVYGVRGHSTAWPGERDWTIKAGELLTPAGDQPVTSAAIVEAIKRVHAHLREPDDDRGEEHWRRLADEVIADLPAEDL